MSMWDDILDYEEKRDPPRHKTVADIFDYLVNDRKESLFMEDITINLGGRDYKAACAEWSQSIGEYPTIEVTAYIDPRYAANRTLKAPLSIKNVIFNPPATIVFWSDNTKTVVKCDSDKEMYDPEKGIAMAISRKMMGDNKREYYNTFLHWLKKWDKQNKAVIESHTTVKVDTDYDCYEYDFED